MKCVQSLADGKVKRVHDTKAHDMVRSGNWKYVPKSVFKDKGGFFSGENWLTNDDFQQKK